MEDQFVHRNAGEIKYLGAGPQSMYVKAAEADVPPNYAILVVSIPFRCPF